MTAWWTYYDDNSISSSSSSRPRLLIGIKFRGLTGKYLSVIGRLRNAPVPAIYRRLCY